MEDTQQGIPDAARSPAPIPPVLAPVLMMTFWAILGGAAGIKIVQGIWPFLGFGGGEVAIACRLAAIVSLVGRLWMKMLLDCAVKVEMVG